MAKVKKQDENELLKQILYHYLEKGTIEEVEHIDKFDDTGHLITKTMKRKVSEIPVQDLLKIYEMVNKLNEGQLNEILLGIK